MPTKIDVADWVSGVPNGAGVSYLYRADGLKVRKMVTDLSSNKRFYTDYLTGFQYGYDEWLFGGTSSVVLSFFPHQEGYVNNRAVYTNPWDRTPSSYVYEYVYNHTDHLGNVHLSYRKNGTTTQILEENNYYPFGLKHKGYNDNSYPTSYKYKYNGKELQDELNLNVYDFSARVFDPASVIAWQHDPLSEQTLTPYSLFYGNPVFYNDPTGMCPNCPNGQYTVQKNDNFHNLEKAWNMPQGSLSQMNSGVDPTKLQIGQTIRTTLNTTDISSQGIKLNSSESLNGMDNFFVNKGNNDQRGVNQIRTISEKEYSNLVEGLSVINKDWKPQDAATGGDMDPKKFFLNDVSGYENKATRGSWFKNNNSVSEPSTRTLFAYRGIGYNLNEFGNLLFGSVASNLKSYTLADLTLGAHAYALVSTGKFDGAHEVRAFSRGYSYYPGLQRSGSYRPINQGVVPIFNNR